MAFIEEVARTPCVVVCNSVGGMSGLQASVLRPSLVPAVQLTNISLRGMHAKRMPSWSRVRTQGVGWGWTPPSHRP